MAKARDLEPVTVFGKLLDRLINKKQVKIQDVASELGITRQYVWALAQATYSKGSPSWEVREKIRDWAKDKHKARVPVDSWPDPTS